ncbi:MAG: hypothetical protein Q9220_006380 [cf. Caloplaca sp. 1 TL-2023]
MFADYVDSVKRSNLPVVQNILSEYDGRAMIKDSITEETASNIQVSAEQELLKQSSASENDFIAVKKLGLARTRVLATEALDYIASKGYSLQDFAVWNFILSARSADVSASRLKFVSDVRDPDLGLIPMFVFLQLLRRTDINAPTLSSLIMHAGHMLESTDHDGGIDTLVQLVTRLLRQSRKVSPAACVDIARLWVKHAKISKVGDRTKEKEMTEQDSARFSFAYNRILSMLALPPNMLPYQSLHHRQRAQFIVIRQMNTFYPPLTVTREGFRAVTRSQLAHRKTLSERKWASLKAESWPPWKEDKLGVDAWINVNHGQSRASESLVQMLEAGYGSSDWEKSAAILGGWDTDNSPTIQTRSTLVPESPSLRLCKGRDKSLALMARRPDPKRATLWIARIRATRTLQDAWTCFLACKDQDHACSADVYHAMFEKVIHERMRVQGASITQKEFVRGLAAYQDPMAGDGREVVGSSSSHNQATPTGEPLPTFETLFDRMTHEDIYPTGRLLAFLLSHAESHAEGIRILKASNLSDTAKDVLMSYKAAPRPDTRQILTSLPNWLFAALVEFLCRSAFASAGPSVLFGSRSKRFWIDASNKTTLGLAQRHARALLWLQALDFVLIRKPLYHPPWNSLLMLLGQPRAVILDYQNPLHGQEHEALYRLRKARWLIYHRMDRLGLGLDFPGFIHLCIIVKNIALVVKEMETRPEERIDGRDQPDLDHLSSLLKQRFAKLVGGVRSAAATPPKILSIPHPAQLHVYIRTLGQLGDYDALSDLANWMVEKSGQIIDEGKETANGMRMFRTCLVAVRVFVEQPLAWYESKGKVTEDEEEPYEKAVRLVDSVREVIERTDGWGGWPTDEEADQYISRGEQHSNGA